ncbi:MAG: hypothetical protein E7606_04765 [Ruminococcaceae bacterium]|nr:hypothetical protein [Oscillospiraceae bacterium]
MLHKILKERGIKEILPFLPTEWASVRRKYLDILLAEEYGTPLPAPDSVTFEEMPFDYRSFPSLAGKATCRKVIAHTVIGGKEFSFPFMATIPVGEGKFPFFVFNNFSPNIPDKYFPTEEIIDNGFAVLSMFYQDVTTDDRDFSNGLAGIVTPEEAQSDLTLRAPNAPGKIAMWAWANMRLLDYAATNPSLDMSNAAVIGHSRLGKTALLTGALDERFRFVIANNAGCSGDAITRKKQGEHIKDISRMFPFWFCENYKKYADESLLTFDQHMLVATIAPRHFLSGAAVGDGWADPESQLLSCRAASVAWEQLGKKGLVAPDRYAEVGEQFPEGNISYHLRDGLHYLSRYDWNVYMNYIKKNLA